MTPMFASNNRSSRCQAAAVYPYDETPRNCARYAKLDGGVKQRFQLLSQQGGSDEVLYNLHLYVQTKDVSKIAQQRQHAVISRSATMQVFEVAGIGSLAPTVDIQKS
jgi:hypothetical protein